MAFLEAFAVGLASNAAYDAIKSGIIEAFKYVAEKYPDL